MAKSAFLYMLILGLCKSFPLARSEWAFFFCFSAKCWSISLRTSFFLCDATKNSCFVGFSSSASTEERI